MTNPTTTEYRSENGDGCRNEWEHWKRQWNTNFSRGHRSLFEVRLPNGRTFSFSLGQLIFFGLLVWWLPFNWLLLGVVLFVAYQIGQSAPSSTADTEAVEKPKRKNDEPLPDDDIVQF